MDCNRYAMSVLLCLSRYEMHLATDYVDFETDHNNEEFGGLEFLMLGSRLLSSTITWTSELQHVGNCIDVFVL